MEEKSVRKCMERFEAFRCWVSARKDFEARWWVETEKGPGKACDSRTMEYILWELRYDLTRHLDWEDLWICTLRLLIRILGDI